MADCTPRTIVQTETIPRKLAKVSSLEAHKCSVQSSVSFKRSKSRTDKHQTDN